MGGRPVNIVEGVAYGLPVTESEFGEPMTPTDGPGEPVIIVDDGGIPVKFINDDMSDYTAGITPAMAMLTAYSRTLTDEVAAYEATYTGASHKTMFDQYGKLTFAPNNLFTYSEDFSNAIWLVLSGITKTANQAVAPNGTTTADKLEATATNGNISLSQSSPIGQRLAQSFYVKKADAGNTIRFDIRDGTNNWAYTFNLDTEATTALATAADDAGMVSVGNGWYRCYIVATPLAAATVQTFIYIPTSGDSFYLWGAQLERVTHETTPRAYNATTSAAYYGYRCVYAPETLEASTTSITIGSGSSYTFTTAAAHSYAVGNVVQATDNADPDNWIRGYVTATTSTTVTLASYTFPGTAYSRPVLTNGSGTISDWSVIRSNGYLAEPAATNLNIYSQGEFDNGTYWARAGFTSVGAPSSEGPGGTTTGSLVTADTSTGAHTLYSTNPVTVVSGSTYATTFCVEKGSYRYVAVTMQRSANNTAAAVFDLDGGGSTATETHNGATSGTVVSTSMKEANGFFYLTLVSYATGTTLYSNISFAGAATGNTWASAGNPTYTSAGTETFYVHSCQTELGSVATSYIPTAASSVSRAADVASMTGANFSGWYNQNTGTFNISFITNFSGTGANGHVLNINDGTTNERHIVAYQSSANLYSFTGDGGVLQHNILITASLSANTNHILAMAYAVDDFGASIDGGTAVTDSSGTLPTVDRMSVGQLSGANCINGTIGSILYFNTRESDAQLVTLTGG